MSEVDSGRRERQAAAEASQTAATRAQTELSEQKALVAVAASKQEELILALEDARAAADAARSDASRLSERLQAVELRAARATEAAAEERAALRDAVAVAEARLSTLLDEREEERRAATANAERLATVSAEQLAIVARCELSVPSRGEPRQGTLLVSVQSVPSTFTYSLGETLAIGVNPLHARFTK
eukprot:scaffold113154_cov35-Tisochrysis_lutea.AAC.3